jgi:CRISPR-associated exonuclease Cas4
MEYKEEDFLQLSGIQHFEFCRRQWALIHIEDAWSENERTMGGKLLHERTHDAFFTEKRGDLIITRDMPIMSRRLGVSGKCDVVEFRRDDFHGVALHGREGKWLPCPVEYKRGSPKVSDADRLQLCAQAVCIEEMLLCQVIKEAYLYYGETKRRETVLLTEELRNKVEVLFHEMHIIHSRGHTPRVKQAKHCNACSLKDFCLPKLPTSTGDVRAYIDRELGDE